jgi:hypothetical protein
LVGDDCLYIIAAEAGEAAHNVTRLAYWRACKGGGDGGGGDGGGGDGGCIVLCCTAMMYEGVLENSWVCATPALTDHTMCRKKAEPCKEHATVHAALLTRTLSGGGVVV